MKRKTEEEKVEEYVNFFEKFCKALEKRNNEYAFSFGVEKKENIYSPNAVYMSYISAHKKGELSVSTIMHPMYEDYFKYKPKKTKLNSLRSLFRKIFFWQKPYCAQFQRIQMR